MPEIDNWTTAPGSPLRNAPSELPEGWSIDKLLGRHPSQPFNPDVANTFFRSGDIEAWGRGIQRILAACRAAGTPEPRIEVDGRDCYRRPETAGFWRSEARPW
ncbi:MAG: ATP-binding protein, partial [bacterium]